MSADQLVDRAVAARPDLQAQESQRTRAARSLALAKRQRFPDLGISISTNKKDRRRRAPSIRRPEHNRSRA